MPRAGLGGDVGIWITEEGFATNLNRRLERQVADLASSVEKVHEYSGTLGVTDFRYFNLRDNDSDGGDLFDAVGLLFDEYTPKPAFGAYRDLIDRFGVDDPDAAAGELRLRLRLRCRGEDVRARVGGPDRGFVRRVRFRVPSGAVSDVVARDRRAPFRRVIRAEEFGDDFHLRVVADISLDDGQNTKLRASRRHRCR
jgi:hypothetical protein